jgi:hypothetical protein
MFRSALHQGLRKWPSSGATCRGGGFRKRERERERERERDREIVTE